jgi:hypothetical protein
MQVELNSGRVAGSETGVGAKRPFGQFLDRHWAHIFSGVYLLLGLF